MARVDTNKGRGSSKTWWAGWCIERHYDDAGKTGWRAWREPAPKNVRMLALLDAYEADMRTAARISRTPRRFFRRRG